MIAVLLYAQAADLVTFLFAATAVGIHGESGILAALVYPQLGIVGMVAWKVILASTFVIYASVKVGKYPFYAGVLAGAGFTVGTVGALSNVAALAVSV